MPRHLLYYWHGDMDRWAMKSAHALLQLLERQRRETHRAIGHRPIGVAGCDVLDELIRRLRVTTDRSAPPDAPLTLTAIQRLPDALEAIRSTAATMDSLGAMMREGAETVEQRRLPLLRFVARIESEGYKVTDDLTVTDATDWPSQATTGDPATAVQLAAEQIARTEQAAIHQQRAQRMAAEVDGVENDYARQIRGLVAI